MDSDRARTEFLDDIFFSLEWLEIVPDEGPGSVKDFQENFSQKLRKSEYLNLVEKLEQQGSSFNCRCSRSEISSRTNDNKYDGFCKDRSYPFKSGMSKRYSKAASNGLIWDKEIPYPVIMKSNGDPSFHIASVCDDVHFGVDQIIRGDDLKDSSEFQSELFHLASDPPKSIKFLHHPVLVDKKGKKISKSTLSNPWVKSKRDKRKLFGLLGKILSVKINTPDQLEGFLDFYDEQKIIASERMINFE